METFKTKKSLHEYLKSYRKNGQRIALVPTMGALHAGHIALIHLAHTVADIVVSSIFVNPTQFNDTEDLKKYPRPIEKDKLMLQEAGCHVLFQPEVEEVYEAGTAEPWHIELGELDNILEAKHRPGHFQGVTQIVKKLFDVVQPDIACFGQKDFQQFRVIDHMVTHFKLPIRLIMVPTVRESDGLAMSSRNTRLSKTGRRQALAIYQALTQIKDGFGKERPSVLGQQALHFLESCPGVRPEYVELRGLTALEPLDDDMVGTVPAVALVAAWVEGVRLIDNILLQDTSG